MFHCIIYITLWEHILLLQCMYCRYIHAYIAIWQPARSMYVAMETRIYGIYCTMHTYVVCLCTAKFTVIHACTVSRDLFGIEGCVNLHADQCFHACRVDACIICGCIKRSIISRYNNMI